MLGARKRIRATLCSAVKSRRVVEFYYHGGFRTAEPYCLGIVMSGEADNESLLCYQVGGHSEYGGTEGWKLFRASEISDLEITGEPFRGDRVGCDLEELGIKNIYCCVSPALETVPGTATGAPSCETPQAAGYLTHNELMRRFRFYHPIPVTELYTNVFI